MSEVSQDVRLALKARFDGQQRAAEYATDPRACARD